MEKKQCPVLWAYTQHSNIHTQVLIFNGSHCERQCWAEAKPTLDGAMGVAQLLCTLVVLLGLACYYLSAQEVKMRDSADFQFFSLKYSFNVSISGTKILGVLINCS